MKLIGFEASAPFLEKICCDCLCSCNACLLFVVLVMFTTFGAVHAHADCEVGSPEGRWVLEDECSPDAWDNIWVVTKVDGDTKYEVDWCVDDCSANCLGTCPDHGTTSPSSEYTPCWAESVRTYRWECVEEEKNFGPLPTCSD